MVRSVNANIDLFDCRHYIIPGDVIRYQSIRACDVPGQVDRYSYIKYEGVVEEVHERFVVVKLKKVRDFVNRWNIIKVNDIPVGNESGYFGGMCVRA